MPRCSIHRDAKNGSLPVATFVCLISSGHGYPSIELIATKRARFEIAAIAFSLAGCSLRSLELFPEGDRSDASRVDSEAGDATSRVDGGTPSEDDAAVSSDACDCAQGGCTSCGDAGLMCMPGEKCADPNAGICMECATGDPSCPGGSVVMQGNCGP